MCRRWTSINYSGAGSAALNAKMPNRCCSFCLISSCGGTVAVRHCKLYLYFTRSFLFGATEPTPLASRGPHDGRLPSQVYRDFRGKDAGVGSNALCPSSVQAEILPWTPRLHEQHASALQVCLRMRLWMHCCAGSSWCQADVLTRLSCRGQKSHLRP